MGGVDTFDQLMEYYRTYIKTKKWTLKTIIHFKDAAVVNSWIQYKQDCQANGLPKKTILDLLAFRLQLAEALVNSPDKLPVIINDNSEEEKDEDIGKKANNWRSPMPAVDKRKDGYNHWPSNDELTTARSCRMQGCKSRTRVRCEKCNVYLCFTGKKKLL